MTLVDARVIGNGRAGGSLARALREAGWIVDGPLGRDADPASAAEDARVVVLAVPDDVVSDVAASVRPGPAVIAHLSGARGLDALAPHERVASIHPLVALRDPDAGASALVGAWFATAGDPVAVEIVDALGGRSVAVDDTDRILYHAAACIAANHLVALLGQVERLADQIGVPLEAYLELARGALDDVAAVGPRRALTGPVARGDSSTVEAHRGALPADELVAYDALADQARRLVVAGADR